MTSAGVSVSGDTTMVDPLVTGLIGFIAGLASSPLLFVGYSALFQTAQSIDNTVDNDEET